MPRISIISPTVRPEGLAIVKKSLQKQTFTDWEWLVASKTYPDNLVAREDPIEITHVPDTFTGGFWSLNRIYNQLFQATKSELCVSWQDWIYVPPDGLQKFWDAYQAHPNALITGVGDQYEQWDGKRKPSIKIWSDPRKTTKYGSFYECMWNDCEWNWAAIPKAAFLDVGGMDEKLDFLGFGGDQLQTCDRIASMGDKWRFFIDQDNESYTVRHGREKHGGQEYWDKHHVVLNGLYGKRKEELEKQGQWPVLIDNQRQVLLPKTKGGEKHG